MNAFAGVRVAVLGSTGFVGRWVARKLSQAGAELLLPVRSPATAREIFQQFEITGELIELDLLANEQVASFYSTMRPSITFNLAGYGIDRNERDPVMAYKINAELPGTIGEAALPLSNTGWRGLDVVHVGSAMEYGTAAGDLAEETRALPTTLYGKSKLAGTIYLKRFSELNGLKTLTARLFSVYGPGERAERLLPSLINARKTGARLPLTDGSHERDFVYVEDVADGLLRLGSLSISRSEIVNLASGSLTSVRDFTETAAVILGIDSDRLNFGALPTRQEEMAHLPVSNRRLRQLIDWIPPTTIEQGVRKTASFSGINPSVTALGAALTR